MKKCYYVAYQHKKGYGNIEILMEREIKNISDVRLIEEEISKNGNKGIVIINWIELQEFEGVKDGTEV